MSKFVFVSLFIFAMAGCKSSTSPSASPMTPAKAGSVFHMTTTISDDNGKTIDSYHATDSIVETGVSYSGKNNVVKYWGYDDHGQSGYGYLAMLDNGDVALYLSSTTHSGFVDQWLTLPYSTGGPVESVILDTTVVNGPVSSRTRETASYSSTAGSSLQVNGETLDLLGVKGTYTSSSSLTANGITQNYPSQTLPPFYYYWSTKIGFMPKSQYAGPSQFGSPTTVNSVLTSYSLK
jgi:hypothetical protein